jgi:hypothetical protein
MEMVKQTENTKCWNTEEEAGHADAWRPRFALPVTQELQESVRSFPARATKRNM